MLERGAFYATRPSVRSLSSRLVVGWAAFLARRQGREERHHVGNFAPGEIEWHQDALAIRVQAFEIDLGEVRYGEPVLGTESASL